MQRELIPENLQVSNSFGVEPSKISKAKAYRVACCDASMSSLNPHISIRHRAEHRVP
jgi:hypothetical protein